MTATTATPPSGVLTQTVERLATVSTLEGVTGVVAGAVRALMGADGATFVLREDGQCFYADADAIEPLWKGSRFPLEACVSGWAMLHDEVVVIPDIYQDARVPHDAYRPTFVTSMCMAPIRGTRPVGALGAYWRDEHTPTASELRQLEVLASTAAVALENLELRGAVDRRSRERDEAQARNDELDSAIHTLAHDLRAPLGAMMGYAEMLSDGLATGSGQPEEFARTILAAGERMAAQIDRMLGLYRVTHQTLAPAPVDLSAMGHELGEEMQGQLTDRDVEVEVEDGLVAVADPVLAHLMLENLMANAFKYTGREAKARIHVGRFDHLTPHSTFYVRDNGAGFDPAQAHRLFRPRQRLHTDAEFPGTGLGLASVARIVELHGGRISAEGRPSAGATFAFTLPVPA